MNEFCVAQLTQVGSLLASNLHLGSELDGVFDKARNSLRSDGGDQRAMRSLLVEAVPHLELADGLLELADELGVDALLHEDAVGADAGLAGGLELADDGAVEGQVQVGVVEDDEGSVSAQLEAQLLEGVAGLAHEDLSDPGGAGEGDLLDNVGFAQRQSDLGGVFEGGHDVDYAGGDTGSLAEDSQGVGGEGGFTGALDDDGATSSQSGSDLSGDHGGGEVPSAVQLTESPGGTMSWCYNG